MNAAKTTLALGIGAACLIGAPVTATADQVKYIGVHPIDAGGFCHIEAHHVHVFAPSKKKNKRALLYRVHDEHLHFVGDPVAHGYDGPKVAYYGHHPIAIDVVAGIEVDTGDHELELCFLDGPHYHSYAPAPDLAFEVKGDAYWFVGTYPPAYERERKKMVRVNAVYTPVRYERPVIEVEPPVAYVGPVVEVSAGARVRAPAVRAPAVRAGVSLEVRAPTLEIGIGVPGVIVTEEHHHHHHHVKVKKHKHKKYKYKSKHYNSRKHHQKRKHRGKHKRHRHHDDD